MSLPLPDSQQRCRKSYFILNTWRSKINAADISLSISIKCHLTCPEDVHPKVGQRCLLNQVDITVGRTGKVEWNVAETVSGKIINGSGLKAASDCISGFLEEASHPYVSCARQFGV